MTSDADLLAVQFRTGFRFDRAGRMLATNDPDHSAAPHFTLSGCASGNLSGVRTDVSDDVASQLIALAATEPPYVDQKGAPRHTDRYRALLAQEGHRLKTSLGLTYVLPNTIAYSHDIQLIDSDSGAGHELSDTLSRMGMPAALAQMGFMNIAEFWPPWCVALHDGAIAAVAFAARLSETGAALGLATVPALRGRGYAAAATCGWAQMPALSSRALFYSTDQTNTSSQRVIARLGLRYLGSSLVLS